MSRLGSRCCQALAVLLTLLPVAATPQTLTLEGVTDRGTLLRQIAAPGVRQAERNIERLLDTPPLEVEAMETILAGPDLDAAGREYLLHSLLLRLRSETPDAALRDFVRRQTQVESTVFVRHDEGPLAVAVYPIAVVADGTLRHWHRVDVERRVDAELRAGLVDSLVNLKSPGSDAYAGTLAALRRADPLAMVRASDWLNKRATGDDYFEARSIVALAIADEARIRTLLETGSGPMALQLVRSIRKRFDAEQSYDLLVAATVNPALGSLAINELDALRSAGLAEAVDGSLFRMLSDPVVGASAAAAIARRSDARVLAELENSLLSPDASARQQARAVLALKLIDTPASRSVLSSALRKDALLDVALQQEVSTWLGN